MSAPRTTHHSAVLRILRYIKGTLLHGLHYSARSSLVLTGYSDADWVGDPSDLRSTTGFCFFFGDSLILWHSKKQTVVSRSSAESEYRSLADTTAELLWLHWLLADLGVSQSSATIIHCDSQSAMKISTNDVLHERTKHIEIYCHLVRHHVAHGNISLSPIPSADQTADGFTKPYLPGRFQSFLSKLKLDSTVPP
ncbi:secreted RxLR effector protein 161-like [Andrographis paniculata]|uniref:secreted RxLR effector protein 161-like n=1 Tax=Andrographis paniculata TaxID=175694 RepID=UPI0021E6EB47|nr:secreted RxLR effector protein 161-like [Andrographis paniculata]